MPRSLARSLTAVTPMVGFHKRIDAYLEAVPTSIPSLLKKPQVSSSSGPTKAIINVPLAAEPTSSTHPRGRNARRVMASPGPSRTLRGTAAPCRNIAEMGPFPEPAARY